MNSDVVPELLQAIESEFETAIKSSAKLSRVNELIQIGEATYSEANDVAIEVGQILAKSFKKNISSDILPDGRMYYNIAERILNKTLGHNYDLVTAVTDQIQKAMNEQAGISIKPINPELNQDKIDGIINRLASEEDFDKVSWILDEPIINFTQSIVDDAIRANAKFHSDSGLSPKIIRRSTGKCCEWCNNLVGTYDYEEVADTGNDVFRRHRNCKCKIEYDPRDGSKRTNVHTHKISGSKEDRDMRIEQEKRWNEKDATDREKRIEKLTKSREQIKNKVDEELSGLQVNGCEIKGVNDHLLDRMGDRSVDIEDIKDAIDNHLKITPVKYNERGEPSFTAVGEKCTVAINPDTGIIVTTHKTHRRVVKKLKGGE